MKVVHYVNQFFAGVGGEDKAFTRFARRDGPVGPGRLLYRLLDTEDDPVEIVTAFCGDTYAAENVDTVFEQMLHLLAQESPAVVVLGPAFNAGRYGLVCGELAWRIPERTGIPAITGLYEENAGVGLFRSKANIVRTDKSAVGMEPAMQRIAKLVPRLIAGESITDDDSIYGSERRRNRLEERCAADRAVDMLLQVLANVDVGTELAIPDVASVPVHEPVTDLSSATVALVTEGGLVPTGNPDHLSTGASSRWGSYPLDDLLTAPRAFESIHGGYDTEHVNASPYRLVPIDVVAEFARAGRIGKLHPRYYVTSGTATKVENCRMMGSQIAEVLRNEGVHAVILTST
jgi:glycine reductase